MRLNSVVLQMDIGLILFTSNVTRHVTDTVPGQVCLADALLFADSAYQAQVPAVDFKMSVQVTLLCEVFMTNATRMGFIYISSR